MGSQKRLRRGLIILSSIVAAGTIGYMAIEGWSALDAVYMTVITISTVGYGEVGPLSHTAQLFTIFLIVGGVGGGLFTLTALIEYIVEGNLGITRRRRQMNAKIAKLKDHIILCGYGRVGEEISRVFKDEGVEFVVIDSRHDNFAMAEAQGYLCMLGDATTDKVLLEAGLERSKGLVAAVGADVDNTYITLSARGLRPNLFIEARASNKEAATKLERAGANRVVLPSNIGARRMAMLALRPAVADFIDTVAFRRGQEWQLETLTADKDSPLKGHTIAELGKKSKAVILAINRKHAKPITNPPADTTIEAGDMLIIMGTPSQLTSLESLCEVEEETA